MSGTTTQAQGYRIGVLASGRGSNLRALHEAGRRDDCPGEVVCCASNRGACGARDYAESEGLPFHHADVATLGTDDAESGIVEFMNHHSVDYVALAGYTKLIGENLLAAFPRRILNIHPGPLPEFGGKGMYGMAVHRAVLEAGVAYSGPSVHLVDENYDEGRLLAHAPVPVVAGDRPETLAARVLEAEHALYWRAFAHYHACRGCDPSLNAR